MNIQELKTIVKEKLTLKEGEFEKLITEATEAIEAFDIRAEQKEDAIVNKVFATLRKQLMNPSVVYEGIVLGVGSVTDFGAKKIYDKIKEKYNLGDETIKQTMIESGEIDAEGNPLWCSDNTKVSWRYQDKDFSLKPANQRKIHPEKEKQRSVLGIFGKFSEGAEPNYKIAYINLKDDKLDIDVPKFQICKVRLGGKLDEPNNCYYLNSTSVTEFIPCTDKELAYEEISEVIRTYFDDENIIDLENIDDQRKLLTAKDKKTVFFTNALCIRATEIDSGFSNVIDIGSADLGFNGEGDNLITCWMPKDIRLPPEGLGKNIVIGRVSMSEDKIFVNVTSLYSQIKIDIPKEIKPEEKVSEAKVEEAKIEEDHSW
jgi:hypothetical protein